MRRSAGLVLSIAAGVTLGAAERHFVGPRAVAMGGAAVASPRPEQAQAYNAAVLGFLAESETEPVAHAPVAWAQAPGLDWGLSLSAGAQLRGDLQPTIDSIQAAEEQLREIEDAGDLGTGETQTYVELIKNLAGLDTDTVTVDADANAVTAVRWGPWALGVGLYGDATGFVTDADLSNLALNAASALATGLNDNAEELIGEAPAGYTVQHLSADQVSALSGAGYSDDAIKALDAQIGDVPPDQLADVVDAVVSVNLDDLDQLGENETRVTLASLTVVEVPLSYGHAITPNLAVGGTLKAMYGRVGGREVRVFDPESKELLFEFQDDVEDSFQLGLDLSLLGRWRWLRAGLHGRNLNEPTFDGARKGNFDTGDVTIDRTLTAAVAVDPVSWVTIELDADLLPYTRLNGRTEWQTISLGAELRAWRAWALRAGCYTNVDSQDERDEDFAITLGAGFAGRRARFAAAIGLAPETVEYDGYEIPKQLRASLGFGLGF